MSLSDLAGQLAAAGMDPAAAERKEAIFSRLKQVLSSETSAIPDPVIPDSTTRGFRLQAEPQVEHAGTAWFVPGRVEVLGKHTDYAGGRSLLCTAERGFCVLAVPLDRPRVLVVDAGRRTRIGLELDPNLEPNAGDWTTYARAVVRRVARNFPTADRGAVIVLESDLPSAAGMSSSSALVIALFLALADINTLHTDPRWETTIRTREDLAGYLAAVENGGGFGPFNGDLGVGTSGGSEDHTAILCSASGHLAQYAFCPVRLERAIPLDRDCVFAIGSSGVHARKTGAAREQYNRAALDTARILALWHHSTGRADASLGAALASDPGAPDLLRSIIRRAPDDTRAHLAGRLEQFFEESERIVPAAGDALAARDYDAFGALVDRSQALAEQFLGNQVPETIELARLARTSGAIAASAFGAGFGGSVWALVPVGEAAAFIDRWTAAYRRAFPDAASRASFFLTRPGPGAMSVVLQGA